MGISGNDEGVVPLVVVRTVQDSLTLTLIPIPSWKECQKAVSMLWTGIKLSV
jgi:hypothetical protein